MTSTIDLSSTLSDFVLQHQYCGDLDGGIEGDRVQWTCTCGAAIDRKVDCD